MNVRQNERRGGERHTGKNERQYGKRERERGRDKEKSERVREIARERAIARE